MIRKAWSYLQWAGAEWIPGDIITFWHIPSWSTLCYRPGAMASIGGKYSDCTSSSHIPVIIQIHQLPSPAAERNIDIFQRTPLGGAASMWQRCMAAGSSWLISHHTKLPVKYVRGSFMSNTKIEMKSFRRTRLVRWIFGVSTCDINPG